jgi:hypothetical protein
MSTGQFRFSAKHVVWNIMEPYMRRVNRFRGKCSMRTALGLLAVLAGTVTTANSAASPTDAPATTIQGCRRRREHGVNAPV